MNVKRLAFGSFFKLNAKTTLETLKSRNCKPASSSGIISINLMDPLTSFHDFYNTRGSQQSGWSSPWQSRDKGASPALPPGCQMSPSLSFLMNTETHRHLSWQHRNPQTSVFWHNHSPRLYIPGSSAVF